MLPPSQFDRINLIKGIDTESWESGLRDVIIKRNVSVKACLSIRLISFRESVAKEEDGVPTRMHSSRMSTVRCSGCLSCHACPATPTPRHARPLHLTYPLHHTCPLCHVCSLSQCMPPPCGQNSRHTLVKTLPFRNYCCGR